ncbi:MAG: hypothetical protein DSY80_03920 [Desulfocapsa sp.]|nr:MAG: hypothetical protein DSY80_03920 [Desulfocapsa sp.]
MAYYEVDFAVANNEDWFESFEMATEGEILDLTDVDLQMDVKSRDGKKVIFSLLTGDGISIDDAENGRFSIYVSRATIQEKPPGRYVHDMLLMRGGRTERLWSGGLRIIKGVTL